jgi:PAS domain S-box-containing protein
MREALEVGNKTRKQLLEELAAAQSRLNELEHIKDASNRVDEAAPAGETHFAHLLRDARIANLLFDPNGNLISASTIRPGALTLDEYQRAVRESLFESAIWTPQIRTRLANGEVLRVRITVDMVRGNGSEGQAPGSTRGVTHLESTVSSLGLQGYLVQVQDITQEVESKAALREREIFFRSVFQAIPSPTVVWRHMGGGEFVLHFFNTAALNTTDGKLAQYEGARLDDFYSHEPAFAQRVRDCFQTGEISSIEQEYEYQTTGKKRFLRVTSARVGHEYVIDSVTDLTELKQAQEALIENEARFRRLLDNAPDIVYRLALKPTMRYEYISPAAETITGFTPQELMADLQFAGTRVYPEDRREPPSSLKDIPAVGAPQLARWIRKDGKIIWLEHRYVVVYEDGEPVALEGTSREVTAEVEARRVLERSLSEKQMLLQEVHHRVKNNLGILSSLIELQAATLPDAQVREILRDTQGRILSVARVHEALYKAGEDTTHIDLADYVSRLGAELREAYAGQGVAIEYELIHYFVSQHRAIHFGLLVNELISNAFKHAFPGNTSGRLQVCLEETDACLHLVVRDNGVGLPSGFDPRSSDSLGVQVVGMLVDQMEGTVRYLSAPGGGTEVRVEIPSAQLINGH